MGVASNVSHSNLVGTSFRVQWNAADAGGPKYRILRYKAEVQKNDLVVTSLVVDGIQTWADISGLEAKTEYRVLIFADNGKGYGDPSVALIVTTQKDNDSGNVVMLYSLGVALTCSLHRKYKHWSFHWSIHWSWHHSRDHNCKHHPCLLLHWETRFWIVL